MNFIEEVKEKAKKSIKTIVLPESHDPRVLQAARKVMDEGFAKVILIGDYDNVSKIANENSINIEGIEVINPLTHPKLEEYIQALFELRQAKGMTLEKARETLKDNIYFGTMMIKMGDADGLVAGSICSTADTLRPSLHIVKTAPNVKLVSSFFVIQVPNCEYGDNGVFLFSDCGLNVNPSAEELSEIAISTATSWLNLFGTEPRVAMLSYSTLGSAPDVEGMNLKVREATRLVREKVPNLAVEGEIQLDAAIVPSVASKKAPESQVAGKANILIFPDINAGNIGYKLVERLAHAEAYGPVTQGIARPVNDLSRGCSVDDIVGVIALTALQAQ